jgi:DNA repair protein RadA/Sms
MLLAVLDRRAGVKMAACDTYVSTVGGVRVSEPAADLAVALAMAGGFADRALVPRTIAFGEVGLAGEIRRVAGVQRRLSEAARLGFTRAIVPRGTLGDGPIPDALQVVEVPDLSTAIRAAMLTSV